MKEHLFIHENTYANFLSLLYGKESLKGGFEYKNSIHYRGKLVREVLMEETALCTLRRACVGFLNVKTPIIYIGKKPLPKFLT